ncbi:MAG TPA: hypothetical protein G4O01_03060 [Dehalococcoidia bacterium]|jgi:type II secretory pathway pseudopilin PulG|nr:hypothetical protein [Dehalococcoidia bacterium]
MALPKIAKRVAHGEAGTALTETVVALAILGVVAISFLNGLAAASKTTFTADELATAESLARSQMEWVKNASYSYNATAYPPAPLPNTPDYQSYSAVITAEPLHTPDDGIQKITITIRRDDEVVTRLEGYKVDR